MIISAIAAVAENGTIGRDNDLPWSLPDDMAWFQRTTRGHHVITGRRNYETIPERFRPLKGRVNIVVTRNSGYGAPGARIATSLHEALAMAREAGETEAFIIGGGQIYQAAMEAGLVDRLYLTRVHAEVPGDTHFPDFDAAEWKESYREEHPADGRHAHAFTFVILDRH